MHKHKIQKQNQQLPPKKYKFYLGSKEKYITISSDFDSGNIHVVRQFTQFQYRLECVNDGTFSNNVVNSKTWFYFRVQGFPKNTKGKFTVSRIQALIPVFYSKFNKCYKPVYKINEGGWRRIQSEVGLVLRETGDLECVFEHVFHEESDVVEFAFCYPYSFNRLTLYLNSLNELYYDEHFYFHKEILTHSAEQRPVHLLTITSYDHPHKAQQYQEIFKEDLFPERCRPLRFNKPVILITARVHPGETPASFTMEGIINFLIDKKDLRAHLLRKMFVFMIVPMINVDGVFHGHFRMDSFGKNLNRFYIKPDKIKQPCIYAIKQLANSLIRDNRLSFYFDLHAHNAKKGSFIYGNAINDFVEQVESQVFCKLFSMNHSGFQYQYCNFSQKHMNARDKNQDLTKEGCGRVVMYRAANIIHSYSIECGIISANHPNILPNQCNLEFEVDGKKLVLDPIESTSFKGQKTADDSTLFTEETYRNLGKNLLVTILDVFDKNPYNRVYNSKYKGMDILRRITAFEIFHQAERFRMFQKFIFGKVKNINTLIQEVLNTKLHYRKLYNFYFYDDKELKAVEWPNNIPGLSKPQKVEHYSKLRKFKSMAEQRLVQEDHAHFHAILNKTRELEIMNTEDHQTMVEGAGNQQQTEMKENNQLSEKSSETDENNDEQIKELFFMLDEQEEMQILKKLMKNQLNDQDLESIELKFKNNYTSTNCESLPTHDYSMNEGEELAKKQKTSELKRKVFHDYLSAKVNNDKFKISRKLIHHNQKQIKDTQEDQNHSVQLHSIEKQKSDVNGSKEKEEEERLGLASPNRMTAGEEFRRNIYDTIKQEIREGLKRQYNKKQVSSSKGSIQLNEQFKKQMRARSTNQTNTKRIKSKVRLPSLGANLYVITTSTKVINKK